MRPQQWRHYRHDLIPIRDVKEIRHLSREQARVRFGPESQETILVVMK